MRPDGRLSPAGVLGPRACDRSSRRSHSRALVRRRGRSDSEGTESPPAVFAELTGIERAASKLECGWSLGERLILKKRRPSLLICSRLLRRSKWLLYAGMGAPSESAALAEARRLLAGWLDEPKPRFRRDPRSKLARSQADLVVEQGRLRLVVEYKGAGGAAVVGQAIDQVKRYAEALGRSTIAVVAVPFMGDVGKALCAEAGISWFDLSGNAHIVGPGLRIIIAGNANRFARRGRPSTAFAPRSARIARRLLVEPKRAFRQRELALLTGLDDGFTSRIVRRLEEDGLLDRADDGAVRVRDPDLLLDAWAEAYRFDKHTILRGHVTARSGEELLAHIPLALEKGKVRYAATGLGAAWLYTRFAGFRLVTLFVERGPSDALLREVGFREEPKGANVWLVVPNDAGVFDGVETKDGIACVHPVQAYVDLSGHPERAKEAAAELRSRLLRRRRP